MPSRQVAGQSADGLLQEQYKPRDDDPLYNPATTDKVCLILAEELDLVRHFGNIATYGFLATVMELNRQNEIAGGAILVRILSSDSHDQQILDRDSEQFEVSWQAVLQKMRDVVMGAMAEDPNFAQAVREMH